MTHLMESWPLVVGFLGVTLGVVSFFHARLREAECCAEVYDIAIKETKTALSAAEHVLASGKLTRNLRLSLLIALRMGSSKNLSERFFSDFDKGQNGRRTDVNCNLAMELRALSMSDATAAEEYQSAVMELILVAPVLHADRFEVLKIASDGATKPAEVLSRLPSFEVPDSDRSVGPSLPVASEIHTRLAAQG